MPGVGAGQDAGPKVSGPDPRAGSLPRLAVRLRRPVPGSGAVGADRGRSGPQSSGRLGRRPVVGLVGGVAAPAVEGVIERHPGVELGQVVLVHARQPERGGEQAGGLGRELRAGGVGAAHDLGEPAQGGQVEAEFVEHGVEAAALAPVAPGDALDVEGGGGEALGDARDLGRVDIEEDGLRIDEAADQPGAGDAVDLGPGAGHPEAAALRIARRQLVFRDQRQARRLPGPKAAFPDAGPGLRWVVDFETATVFSPVDSPAALENFVLPVRGEAAGEPPPAPVPQTGQMRCWDSLGNKIGCAGTGQDGDIRAGVEWPNRRFKDNRDGTITDNLTGLIWLEDANCPDATRTWEEALADVAELNNSGTMNENECINYSGIFTDWRLPNIRELASLVDYEIGLDPVLPSPNPFMSFQSDPYWSSTTSVFPNDAWFVGFDSGAVADSDDKAHSHFVTAVRGGS